ncbi:AsmA family protein [Immundisolibacter sp.]|uniref:AsmA family protein n=1 Tax=Immundisolibacter sp. TaxID=1934948 RepID=UPI0035693DE4
MKARRRLLLSVGFLLGGLVAAAALLPRLVDSETLRSMLIIAARSHTGRELTIEGDIRLTLLPRPAIVLPRLSLADAAGFDPEPFASVTGARATLKLWPLLRGRLAIANVRVDQPLLRLTVDQNGARNWADLLPDSPEVPATAPGVGRAQDGIAGRIGVGEVSVRAGDILWTDHRSGRWVRARGLDFTLGNLEPSGPIPVAASATLDMGDPLRSARLDLSATLQRDGDGIWHGSGLRLEAELSGAPLQQALALRLASAASFDPAQSRLRLRQLVLDAAPLQVQGELTVARAKDAPVLGAQLQLVRLDARALAAYFGVTLVTTDPAVLKRVAGDVELSASAVQLKLAKFALSVDDSQWHGTASLTDYEDPKLSFALEGDSINADRYAPSQTAVTPLPESESPQVVPDDEVPNFPVAASPEEFLKRLAQIRVAGTVNLGALTARGARLDRVFVQVSGGAGRLALQPARASFYGGALDASLGLDARGADPVLNLKLAATDVAAGPMLLDIAGKDAVQGRFTLGIEGTAAAATGAALLRSLNGTLRLDGSDGVLKGINADRDICQARVKIASLRGKAGPECDLSPDTRFSVLRVSGKVRAGVWHSDDLFLEQQRHQPGQFYQLRGAGSLDLPTSEVDYRLRTAALRRGGDGEPDVVKEAPVRLRVTGRPGDFKVRPQLAAGDETMRRLQEKLAPKAGDSEREQRGKALLRGLLGR